MTTLRTNDFDMRAPGQDDAQQIVALTAAADINEVGQPNSDLDALLRDWNNPGFDLSKDARVIETNGQIVGYGIIYEVLNDGRIMFDGYVHPAYTDRGLGTQLLRWTETRARERIPDFPETMQVYMRTNLFGDAGKAHTLLRAEGYTVVRHLWRMEIGLDEPPAAPQWPRPIRVRTFVPGQDEYATWQTMNRMFETDWEYVPVPFDEWLATKINDAPFDESLWFLAIDEERNDQIVGMARGNYRQEIGWIRTLGVIPDWRRRGVATALLQHSFGEFYKRGKRRVGLGVDAQNPTGATQLYERAGMHAAQVFTAYDKVLRPGTAPSEKDGGK